MTGIEWVLNPDGTRGITVNSKTGCLNHTPEGLCLGGLFPCYAFKLAHGRLKPLYLANVNYKITGIVSQDLEVNEQAEADPFYPRFWPERLDKIRAIKKPIGIFLDDMSDWMGDYWPEEWTRQELQLMRDCPQHRFYTLTKQPQNLPHWKFPENCWVGVTATNQQMAQNALKFLAQIKASIKFISCEPLLSRIDLADAAGCGYYCDPSQGIEGHHDHAFLTPGIYSGIDWLIIEACTGTLPEMVRLVDRYPPETLSIMRYGKLYTAQPRIEWVKEIVQAADKVGISVFLKDNLKPLLPTDDIFGQEDAEYRWQLRQEMPE